MFNYPELFTKDWWYLPSLTPEGREMLSNRFIAYRLYDGITLKLKGRKWFFLHESEWHPVKPSWFKKNEFTFNCQEELREALYWLPVNWPPELKPAWLPGVYELVLLDYKWRLIQHGNFDQLSHINKLEMQEFTATQTYDFLKEEIKKMQVDGILFKSWTPWSPEQKYVIVRAEGFGDVSTWV